MMKLNNNIVSILVAAALTLVGFAASAKEIPIEHFALRDVVSSVRISPDGNYLSLMKIPTKDGDPVIEIYDANDLSAKPFRMNADPMEITEHDWVSNDEIVFSLRQKVRDKIEGFNQGVYETRIALLDVKKQKLKSFKEENVSIANLLPGNPNRIIISFSEGGADGPASRLSETFRPRAYYEFDLKRGTKKLLIRGKLTLGNIEFDKDGDPWLARGFDIKRGELIWYYRDKEQDEWDEFYRQHEDLFDDFSVLAKDDAAPGHVLVLANNGADKAGLWSYDVDNKKFAELIYRRKDVDVYGVRFNSNNWTSPDNVSAVTYYKDKFHAKYFDPQEEAIYKQLDSLIPNAGLVRITNRSRDGADMIVYNESDRDPGTYFLLKDGKFQVVGSRQPLIKSEDLAEVRYITYKARDGRDIPAFLTVPNSKPPYPLVVLPHGGPFVQEVVIYDEWAQLLANRGYMVMQPQYRGSRGYGLDHYTSAFMQGGQGGYKMQDDKDDGALHLVKEGLADPDRLAMFGWSYGGYAALIAAARKDQIYQCVVAGAAVTDTNMQVNYYRYLLRGAPGLEQLRMWDDSIAPIEEVDKVNVPMLLVHGNVDQRVPPDHAEKYRKLLEKYNKDFEYLELDGADHFSSTLFYNHQYDFYTAMTDYLKNDCGPGGL